MPHPQLDGLDGIPAYGASRIQFGSQAGELTRHRVGPLSLLIERQSLPGLRSFSRRPDRVEFRSEFGSERTCEGLGLFPLLFPLAGVLSIPRRDRLRGLRHCVWRCVGTLRERQRTRVIVDLPDGRRLGSPRERQEPISNGVGPTEFAAPFGWCRESLRAGCRFTT